MGLTLCDPIDNFAQDCGGTHGCSHAGARTYTDRGKGEGEKRVFSNRRGHIRRLQGTGGRKGRVDPEVEGSTTRQKHVA